MKLLVEQKLFSWMCQIRRTLHRDPELAYQEEQTSALIARELERLGIPFQTGLAGGTGIRAEIAGSGEGGCVALRADMDALPIREETGLEFSSTRPGIMHACGHDGHVAMLLGAASLLKKQSLPGTVVLLFQPAEESGNGADRMVQDQALQGVDRIFSGHIDSHYSVGQITVDEGLICAYTDPFTITIQGSGGHAARPHETVDAVVVASNLVMNMQTLISRRINPSHAAVVTVGRLEAGTVHNVIAEHALLEGTVRSTHQGTRERILQGLAGMITGLAAMSDAEINVEFVDGLPAVINDVSATALARDAAVQVVGEENVVSQGPPSLGGEDFSFYQQQIPGCMVRFGGHIPGKKTGPAHSSRFDFAEETLRYGALWLARVAAGSLSRESRSSLTSAT